MCDDPEVVIAGGSVAGCALAALLGRQGIRTTVLEKGVAADHYKVVCTHFIQPGATPVIERLGLAEPMERAGAVRNGLEIWTDAGWYMSPPDLYGYSLRRSKLDPMLRDLAAGTPNVAVRRGVTVTAVLREGGRPAGLRGRTPAGEEVEVRAKVVVGADGRGSAVARLAGIPGRVLPHNRFGYASGRRMNPVERMVHRAAVRDPETARLSHEIGAREKPITQIMRPSRLARAAVMAGMR
jgi:menaquinone-9 beta-reductase